jgi:hypothetical protein
MTEEARLPPDGRGAIESPIHFNTTWAASKIVALVYLEVWRTGAKRFSSGVAH